MDIRIPQSGNAAKQARSYLASQGVAVTHTQALELVARLHGYADLQAMKADEATRYADPHALKSESANEYVLKEGQSHAWVTVDQVSVRIARKEDLARVELFTAGEEDMAPATGAELAFADAKLSAEGLERLCMQYEAATGESGDMARRLVQAWGSGSALRQLRENMELVIGLGPCLVRSATAQGYWNENQGWVFDKRSATGYAVGQLQSLNGFPADAQLVDYDNAVDFDPNEEPPVASK
jgi:hypothetical protein